MKLKLCLFLLIILALVIFFVSTLNKSRLSNLPNVQSEISTEGDVITSDGVPLHWWKFNRKSSITTYVLHGGPDGQTKGLRIYGDELADILGTVVFYDRRGCGVSGRNVATSSMTYLVAAADLKAIIDQTSPPDSPIVLLGSSFGGTLAVHVAPFFKDRLKGVILSSPFLDMDAEIQGRRVSTKSSGEQHCQETSTVDEAECVATVGNGWSLNEHYLLKSHLSELSALHVPTLMITGACDSLSNASVVAAAKKALPQLQAITIPNGDHRALFDQTGSIKDALLDFMQKI